MDREVFTDIKQNTPEWFACRAGIPTASMFHAVMAKGKSGELSKTRRTYLLTLIAERITGVAADNISTYHMRRGQALEPEARDTYAMIADVVPEQVGFIRYRNAGCSPDSLVGADGMLEIKTRKPELQLELLLDGNVPTEHIQQIQGQLWVADRKWVDFVSYWPGLPIFIKRVERDEKMIGEISAAVNHFNAEMNVLLKEIQEL